MTKPDAVAAPLRVAVVGSGITGLAAASHLWAQCDNGSLFELTLYEKDEHIGGHACTKHVGDTPVDVGFMVCNQVTYPNLLAWFDRHGVELEGSDMSLSVSLPSWLEWSSNGLTGLLACRNALDARRLLMLRDILRFKADVLAFLVEHEAKPAEELAQSDTAATLTLQDFCSQHGYSSCFIDDYLIPVCASVWSCPAATAMQFPALFILVFLRNHHLLQLTNRPEWLTIAGRSQQGYVQKVIAPFRHCIRTSAPVSAVAVLPSGKIRLTLPSGTAESYDYVVLACHAPTAVSLLGADLAAAEREVMSCFTYQDNEVVLHQDAAFLPKSTANWASWNFLGNLSAEAPSSVTYYLNRLQNLDQTSRPVLVTLNPSRAPSADLVVSRTVMSHPVPTVASYQALRRLHEIQGRRGLWFAGAWAGWGFHEDGYKSGEQAAHSVMRVVRERLLHVAAGVHSASLKTTAPAADIGHGDTAGKISFTVLSSAQLSSDKASRQVGFDEAPVLQELQPEMESWSYLALPNPVSFHERYSLFSLVTPARIVVLRFLRSFIQLGRLQLREAGGCVDSFGSVPSVSATCSTPALMAGLVVHAPAFYTHVAFRGELGLADAYIDGSMTSPDLLTFLRLLLVNAQLNRQSNAGRLSLSALFTASVGTAIAALSQAWLKRNTVAQSRHNISAHYDTGNDFFALFLDESMSYSCALYDKPTDSLEQAQANKMQRLIDRADIQSHHTVLEIGCGWGALSREMATSKGCRVLGITLSSEQLTWCQEKAKAAGLDQLCSYRLVDYRVLGLEQGATANQQYDRIVSCEMLEAVGHEYLPDFFRHCDRLLAPRGLLVVQVISFPDGRYEEYRRNVDFIREQIFPGGLCPSLAALTDAMQRSSQFMVESVENIGPHYVRTLGEWRKRLAATPQKRRKELGLTAEFMRKWDYYFAYSMAGFIMRCIGTLHIVFTRPGNNEALDQGKVWWP